MSWISYCLFVVPFFHELNNCERKLVWGRMGSDYRSLTISKDEKRDSWRQAHTSDQTCARVIDTSGEFEKQSLQMDVNAMNVGKTWNRSIVWALSIKKIRRDLRQYRESYNGGASRALWWCGKVVIRTLDRRDTRKMSDIGLKSGKHDSVLSHSLSKWGYPFMLERKFKRNPVTKLLTICDRIAGKLWPAVKCWRRERAALHALCPSTQCGDSLTPSLEDFPFVKEANWLTKKSYRLAGPTRGSYSKPLDYPWGDHSRQIQFRRRDSETVSIEPCLGLLEEGLSEDCKIKVL